MTTPNAPQVIAGVTSVYDKTARNNIPIENRQEGALVHTKNTNEYWFLNNAPWNMDDADWTLVVKQN